jgi:chorismate dehydratase
VTLRVGQISYANCTPIFVCLKNFHDCSNYRFVHGTPSRLNSMLATGEIDICPSSSIEFAKHPQKYLILPNISISSDVQVKSVLLFSRLPIEEINRQNIGLTDESATSVNLLKIILRRFYCYENSYHTLNMSSTAALADYPAILLIGDAALKEGIHRSEGTYVYDLGELWHRFTGLPFVFALWLVREETVARQKSEVETFYSSLCHSKKMAGSSFDAIASSCREDWISENEIIEYWKTISYDLTSRHVEGLQTFFRYAADLSIIDHVPDIRLFR